MAQITPTFIREVQKKATLLVSEQELTQAFDQLADDMTSVLADKNPVFLTVMNGGLMTMSELAKRLNFPAVMDYIHASRYQGETTGGSSIHWKREPSQKLIEGRCVVIVDDVLDGGITLSAIIDYCQGNGAREVYTAVMLDKPEGRESGALAKADFTGLEIENRYVYGFGLDYHEYLRNVPAIYAVAEEHMI